MTNKQALDALELPPCTSFCKNSDNSNGICRACLERENTSHGILKNIAKRMIADSCVDYPQWLFTLVEAGIKTALSQPQPCPEPVVDGLYGAIKRVEEHQEWRRGADTRQPNPEILGQNIDIVLEAARLQLSRQKGGE